MKIKVVSERIIKPSNPTPNHLRFLPTSLIDQIYTPVLMPLIFFYHSQNLTTKIDTREVLDRLSSSLPKTLSIFYPLGGRVLDANYIECTDEGVPYIEAEVEKPLELKDVIYKAEPAFLDKLAPPYGQGGYSNLLLAIQVNIFSCGGIAIGVKTNHIICDAFSKLMFVKTWASIAKDSNNLGTNINIPRPCFDAWKLFPPSLRKGKDVDANHNPDLIKDVPVTKLFMFSETKLLALRSKLISSYVEKGKIFKYSLAMILSAFIWSRVKVACHSCNIGENIPNEVNHFVNLRPKLVLPDVQSYYFGNLAVKAIAKPSMKINNEDNETMWLCDIMEKMYESIKKVSNEVFIGDMKESKEDLRFSLEQFERHSRGEVTVLGFSNLTPLPIYEADFGWGKPIWVTNSTIIFKDSVVLCPASPSGKDIVASISLMGEDMTKLERDTKFKEFVCKAFHATSKL